LIKSKFEDKHYQFNTIRYIDDMNVRVTIHLSQLNNKTKSYSVYYEINSEWGVLDIINHYDVDPKTCVKKCMTQLYKDLPDLKIDKLSGYFYLHEVVDEELSMTYFNKNPFV
jgi:hypothetical protein